VKGDYDSAEPLYKRALAIIEKVLGKEHPSTATSLNNLAGVYQAKGDYDSAERLYKRALEILEKRLGSNHPNTVTIRNNLAYLLLAQRFLRPKKSDF
jgi:tetratricopeptide (TPR) repeat protein